jgi:hypothetical protein
LRAIEAVSLTIIFMMRGAPQRGMKTKVKPACAASVTGESAGDSLLLNRSTR